MKAIQYRAYGDYAENKLADLPPPLPTDGQVLVRDEDGGDQSARQYVPLGSSFRLNAPNLPRVGGQMGAGVVVESKSSNFKPGERVFVTGPGFGVVADGVWRELVAAPAAGLWPIPDNVDDDHAAAFLAGAGYLDRLSGPYRIRVVPARAERSCAGDRRRGGNGERAARPPAWSIARHFNRQHDRESRNRAGRRLRPRHRLVQGGASERRHADDRWQGSRCRHRWRWRCSRGRGAWLTRIRRNLCRSRLCGRPGSEHQPDRCDLEGRQGAWLYAARLCARNHRRRAEDTDRTCRRRRASPDHRQGLPALGGWPKRSATSSKAGPWAGFSCGSTAEKESPPGLASGRAC